jgi:phenylalanyl-tRNA synthetase alpha chain
LTSRLKRPFFELYMTDVWVKLFAECKTINECLSLKDKIGSEGRFAQIKSLLPSVDVQQKKMLGGELNELKQELKRVADARIQTIQEVAERDNFLDFDPTFASPLISSGSGNGFLHPITEVTEEIVSIFSKMGFDVFDGPQVESQWNNFTSVGIPSYHPGRSLQDTFFLEQKDENGENYVMRTQVTANIGRYAQGLKPPFKVIFPGTTFRAENIDATHDINFHQFDMWLVDKNASMGQLVSLIKEFFQEFFNDPDLKLRLRPSYYPFVQPGFDGDIYSHWFKGGRWIEVCGAGPIHRDVLRNIGLDDNEWQGIAFGFGLTRLAQLKLQITGLSQFYDGHLDFTRGRIV